VVRNRLRRRLRALLRPGLAAQAGVDLVVVATPAAADRAWDALGADLHACLGGALARLRRGAGLEGGPPREPGGGAAAAALRDNRQRQARSARAHPAGDRPAPP
jgi:hypothetical protein